MCMTTKGVLKSIWVIAPTYFFSDVIVAPGTQKISHFPQEVTFKWTSRSIESPKTPLSFYPWCKYCGSGSSVLLPCRVPAVLSGWYCSSVCDYLKNTTSSPPPFMTRTAMNLVQSMIRPSFDERTQIFSASGCISSNLRHQQTEPGWLCSREPSPLPCDRCLQAVLAKRCCFAPWFFSRWHIPLQMTVIVFYIHLEWSSLLTLTTWHRTASFLAKQISYFAQCNHLKRIPPLWLL